MEVEDARVLAEHLREDVEEQRTVVLERPGSCGDMTTGVVDDGHAQ
jgi:hypothetical protein